MSRYLALGFCLAAFVSPSLPAATSDSDRLERLERAVQLLQERNAELEREVSSLKKQKSSTAPLTAEKRSRFVPDSKSYVERSETTEEKKPVYVVPAGSEIKLALGGLLQTQYEAGDVSAFEGRFGSTAIDDRFRLRRMRINVTGDFAEQFDFKLEGEFAQTDTAITVRNAMGATIGSNATRTSFGGLDLWGNWHQFPAFQIKVGQYKAPFGFEQISPDPKLLTPERSQVTSGLTPERQIGVQIWGKPLATVFPDQKDLLTYYAGLFNGNGRNVTINDNDEYMYVGRLELQPLKTKIFEQDARLKLGVNALSSHDAAGTVLSPAGSVRVNSDGSLSAFTAPSAAERTAYGLDAYFHLGPFDLMAEYLREDFDARPVNGIPPLFNDFRADGYYVQAGYYLIPKKLQLVAKYESFDPGQIANDNLSSITGGLNYYLKGDDIKSWPTTSIPGLTSGKVIPLSEATSSVSSSCACSLYIRFMEQSIRNQLPGTIKSIVFDKVLSEVIVETSIGEVASIITTRSIEEMKLKAGDQVFVLVKATNVSLARRG